MENTRPVPHIGPRMAVRPLCDVQLAISSRM
jgi:hypothetical protein